MNQGGQVSPESSLLEFAGAPERLSVSKVCISNTQNDFCSVNEAMQVDESFALRSSNRNIKHDCTACPNDLQQSQTCNAEAHQIKELPEEKIVVPFSLNECPSGNEASQPSTDSFCEQVYQDLQQQLEDDHKKKQAIGPIQPSQNILLKRSLTGNPPLRKALVICVDSRLRNLLQNPPQNEVMALAIIL